jgi:hypothetical protein
MEEQVSGRRINILSKIVNEQFRASRVLVLSWNQKRQSNNICDSPANLKPAGTALRTTRPQHVVFV